MKVKMEKGRKWIYFNTIAIGKKDEAYYTESEMLSSPLYHYANLSKSEKEIYNKLNNNEATTKNPECIKTSITTVAGTPYV